ncbi:ADP-ribose pyrophosphatase [Propionicimonas paludicola]|uniref:ADP-ribose pyrophosphatase n=1 Tax=Propionicimonas paludicola TaxID=185243 RepID=A0A2A9CQ38_9ACTN|nr:NUDIX hydrolase [Propionicimonas paludicola]PFG16513.1 ADP-ribose pyrophosphatase [Propionicimonas paludicola]
MARQLRADQVQDRAELWPVTSHQIMAQGAVAAFVTDQVTTPDGESMRRQYTLHPGAVGIIALDDDDRVAVVRQYRHPVAMSLIEPPAGLLDKASEDFLVAAQRELAEEAGLAATDWRVLVDLFTSPGGTQESLRIFLARGLSDVAAPEGFVAEAEEAEMELAWVARADLVEAVLAGRVQNPTLVSGILALETARLSGRLDELRPAGAPWPARAVWSEQNSMLAAVRGHAG